MTPRKTKPATTVKKAVNSAKAKTAGAKRPARTKGKSSWFDESTQSPLIAEKARQMKSFLAAAADGIIDKKELKAQEERLIRAMKEVEPLLDAELHAKVTALLCELTAYDLMQVMHSFHKAKPKTAFRG